MAGGGEAIAGNLRISSGHFLPACKPDTQTRAIACLAGSGNPVALEIDYYPSIFPFVRRAGAVPVVETLT